MNADYWHVKGIEVANATDNGIIVIKAQRFRSQDKNREDALTRLAALVKAAGAVPKKRKPTKPSRSSQTKRMDSKTKHGQLKSRRGRVEIAHRRHAGDGRHRARSRS